MDETMLLKSYRKEIFRPVCNPGFESLHCIARLDQDVSAAIPYLRECGEPTCMVFAVRLPEGAKGPEGCPELDPTKRERLQSYLSQFKVEVL